MTSPLRQRFPALTRKRVREIQLQYGDDPTAVGDQLPPDRHPSCATVGAVIGPGRTCDWGIVPGCLREELAAETWQLQRESTGDACRKMPPSLTPRMPDFIATKKSHACANCQTELPTIDSETRCLDVQHHSNIQAQSISA